MTAPAVVEDGAHVEIVEACLDTDADIGLAEAAGSLSDGERARAAAFVFEQDRARFIRAHGVTRRALGAALGVAPRRVPIEGEPGAKPFIAGGGLYFNLSHSGSRLALALSHDGEIGVDLETLDRTASLEGQLEGLSQLCFTPDEQVALSQAPGDQRIARFLSFWTAKEARMKLTGEGMALEPRSISLRLSGGQPVGYARPRGPAADLRFIPMSHPGAICCLATLSPGGQ